MSFPSAPNTPAVLQTMQANMQALMLNDGSANAYNTVKIGGIKDFTELALPVGQIIPRHDDSQRHAFGGTIMDHTDLEIRSICDNTDEAAAELQVAAIRDALMPLLNKYATFPGLLTVYSAKIKPNSAAFAWMWLKPNWYRVHTVTLTVAQYYVIPGGIQ